MRILSKTSILVVLGATLALAACQREDGSRVADDGTPEAAYNGHIRLSLAHPYNTKKDDYELLMAAPSDVISMAVCEIKPNASCQVGSPTYYGTDLIYVTPEHRYFKADASALLEDGLLLSFVGYDKAGTPIDTRTLSLVSSNGTPPSGGSSGTPPSGGGAASNPTPNPAATTAPAGDDAAVRSIVEQNCGRCHAGYASDPSSLKATNAAQRISSGNMPQDRPMDDSDRDALLEYLGG